MADQTFTELLQRQIQEAIDARWDQLAERIHAMKEPARDRLVDELARGPISDETRAFLFPEGLANVTLGRNHYHFPGCGHFAADPLVSASEQDAVHLGLRPAYCVRKVDRG